jgi:hypothetical protein
MIDHLFGKARAVRFMQSWSAGRHEPLRHLAASQRSRREWPAVLREPADGRQPVRFTLLETLLNYRPTAYF